jgi:hypothetical protein
MLGVASNDLDDGLSALTEALAAADEHAWCELVAEIYRLEGELLPSNGSGYRTGLSSAMPAY